MAAGGGLKAGAYEAELAEVGVKGASMGREEFAEEAGYEAAEDRAACKRATGGGVAGGGW